MTVDAKLFRFPSIATTEVGSVTEISLTGVEQLPTDESMLTVSAAHAAIDRALACAVEFAEATPRIPLTERERAAKRPLRR